ncbi:hypothetical protein WG909_04585 [Peptostreptococcaceae bacterium AGR-M142]
MRDIIKKIIFVIIAFIMMGNMFFRNNYFLMNNYNYIMGGCMIVLLLLSVILDVLDNGNISRKNLFGYFVIGILAAKFLGFINTNLI